MQKLLPLKWAVVEVLYSFAVLVVLFRQLGIFGNIKINNLYRLSPIRRRVLALLIRAGKRSSVKYFTVRNSQYHWKQWSITHS